METISQNRNTLALSLSDRQTVNRMPSYRLTLIKYKRFQEACLCLVPLDHEAGNRGELRLTGIAEVFPASSSRLEPTWATGWLLSDCACNRYLKCLSSCLFSFTLLLRNVYFKLRNVIALLMDGHNSGPSFCLQQKYITSD